MKKAYVEQKLKKLESIISNLDKQIDRISDVFPNVWECEAADCAWRLVDAYIDSIAELTMMDKDVLLWWVYDCEFGKGPSECVLEDGTKVLCKDLESFMTTLNLSLED